MAGIYLSAIEYALGEPRSIAELSGGLDARLLEPDSGLSSYRSSDLEIWQLATAAGAGTLAQSAEPPDLLLYVSENDPDASASLTKIVRSLGLPAVRYLRMSGHDCGNLGPALLLARQALGSGEYRRVLLLLADKATDGDRSQASGLSVVSDGAVACLVTGQAARPGDEQFAVHAIAPITSVDAKDAAEDGDRIMAAMAQSVACATAITEQTGREVEEYDHLIFPNYRVVIQEFLCSAMGAPPERLLIGPLAEFGHCFSADVLVTLTHCASIGQIKQGDHVLASSDGPACWSTFSVERLS